MQHIYSWMYLFVLFAFAVLFAAVTPSPILAFELKSKTVSARLDGEAIFVSADHRAKVLKAYLATYNSPLADNAETFVRAADAHELDYRLVAAISGVESTFGKQLPNNSYNAWGWGIYGDNVIRFSSYDEVIKTISKELRERYIDEWKADDVYKIGRYYAASPTWASRVDYFMEDMQKFELSNPTLTLSPSL